MAEGMMAWAELECLGKVETALLEGMMAWAELECLGKVETVLLEVVQLMDREAMVVSLGSGRST